MYQMFHCSKFTLGSSLELAATTPLRLFDPDLSHIKGGGFKLLSGAICDMHRCSPVQNDVNFFE